MKKVKLFLLASLSLVFVASGMNAQNRAAQDQNSSGYKFTVVKEAPITSIKNQNRTSTCWSFSAVSFLESEVLRMGKGSHDLSEMFVVSHSYFDKAVQYVRTRGASIISPGSSFGDVLYVLKNYGMAPEEVMSGLNYGEESHVHGELDASVGGFTKAIERNPNGKLSPVWKNALQGIIDAYLGKVPETFKYQGKEYNPKTFASSLGLEADNYVSFSSFTHHPFYSQFVIEVSDNWRWDLSYNLPLDELVQVVDNAVENGYTVMWASDISEKGFNRKGIAIVPETDTKNMSGSDQQRWLGVSRTEMDAQLFSLKEVVKERNITQEERQVGYDNLTTTDDHGMHIYGIAKESKGGKFYMVKNSWGETGDYKGIWYVSEPFFRFKTMNIVVHKDAIPKDIRKKLNL